MASHLMSLGSRVAGNATPSTTAGTNDEEDFVIVDAPSFATESASGLVTPSLIISDTILGLWLPLPWVWRSGGRLNLLPGSGSHGTVVFKGSLEGRSVAVKRLLRDFVALALRELSVVQENDGHPNVVRYYRYWEEEHTDFNYVVLERCPASLVDIIESPDAPQYRDVVFDPKKALREITSGLRHLHALGVVHRDIRPRNILISDQGEMLISDYGLYDKAHSALGWRAPEVVRGEVKLDDVGGDQASDIFALGCLFYYVLSNGEHPYGSDTLSRETNISRNGKSLQALDALAGAERHESADLIEQMLRVDPLSRPDTMTCLVHPFFWGPGQRLKFLQDASDRFEVMCRSPRDPILDALERDAGDVVGDNWRARLGEVFSENLGVFRKYDAKSVQDLLRALRLKKHHYQDLPENVKRHVGSMPEGYLSYFTDRYPRLILHVYRVVGERDLRTECMFRTYYELT